MIDGDLFATTAPHWKHQNVAVKIGMALETWSVQTGLGEVAINPGLVFSEIDSVISDGGNHKATNLAHWGWLRLWFRCSCS